MNYKIELYIALYPDLFINSIKFLEKTEKIKIEGKKIVTCANEVSKLRANINLILRCLKIHEELLKWKGVLCVDQKK